MYVLEWNGLDWNGMEWNVCICAIISAIDHYNSVFFTVHRVMIFPVIFPLSDP